MRAANQQQPPGQDNYNCNSQGQTKFTNGLRDIKNKQNQKRI